MNQVQELETVRSLIRGIQQLVRHPIAEKLLLRFNDLLEAEVLKNLPPTTKEEDTLFNESNVQGLKAYHDRTGISLESSRLALKKAQENNNQNLLNHIGKE